MTESHWHSAVLHWNNINIKHTIKSILLENTEKNKTICAALIRDICPMELFEYYVYIAVCEVTRQE